MGSIPAWAGETQGRILNAGYAEVYPRVGGGNVGNPFLPVVLAGLSPRGRGKRRGVSSMLATLRSIPAWAGETVLLILLTPTPTVYPRVGGGNGA